MQRILASAASLLFAAVGAQAQTSINITNLPNNTSCLYSTGSVTTTSTPGQLQAAATATPTGAGCGSTGTGGSVSFGPASPLSPATTTLSNTGGTATLVFQAVNATQCTGSISGASGGIFTGGSSTATICNATSAPCTGAQSLSTTFPANTGSTNISNTVMVTCTGGNQAQSTATVVVQNQPISSPGACSRSIVNSAGGSFNSPATGTKLTIDYIRMINGGNKSVDPSLFSNIYETAWPGNYNDNIAISLPTNQYIAAQFTTPANFFNASQPNFPAGLYGLYSIQQTYYSAPISMTISTSCGDFSSPSASGSTVVSGCVLNLGTNSNPNLEWTASHSCALTGGTTYYLNIINADISKVTPTGGTATSSATKSCTGGICVDPIENGGGTWSTWNGTGYNP